jgi:sugar phosphate isomerase/epimerase
MYQLSAINSELSTDLDQALSIAKDFGLQSIEIHTIGGECVETLHHAEVQVLKKTLDQHGMQVCCIASTAFLRCPLEDHDPIPDPIAYPSIGGNYSDHLMALENALSIANKLDAPQVRIFGFVRRGPTTEQVYQRIADRLDQPMHMAQAAGVRLVLETCPHTYLDWGVRAAHFASMVDTPWLKILWDPAGPVRAGEQDYMAPYPQLRPHLGHVHAKDILIDPTLEGGRAYVPIGQGMIQWTQILGKLAEDGYGGWVSLEPHHVGPDGRLESAARASFKSLDGIYQALRRVDQG